MLVKHGISSPLNVTVTIQCLHPPMSIELSVPCHGVIFLGLDGGRTYLKQDYEILESMKPPNLIFS